MTLNLNVFKLYDFTVVIIRTQRINTMNNKENDVTSRIKQYIVKESFSQKEDVQCDTLIFENSLLDSMGFLFLIDFLKDEFEIDVEDNELINENFESINSISMFVFNKIEATQVVTELRV